MAGYKVLVTGGSGFLGQHIVKHLQLYVDNVIEIRVLDLVHYEQKLDFDTKIEVTSFVGSITDSDLVCKSCCGVDAVIHVASLIDTSFLPNTKALREVNIKGTETVIRACIQENVKYLVYCGSISAVQGYEEVVNGTETTVPIPCPRLMFKDYGTSKYQAQTMVLNADGKATADGSILHTVALLPLTMYGELDNNVLIKAFNGAATNGGSLQRAGNGKALAQFAYVGNVAFAFICAFKSLTSGSDVGGQFFFISDDTPPQNTTQFVLPYLKLHDFRLSKFSLPMWLIYVILGFLQIILYIISPLKRIKMPVSLSAIIFTNVTFVVTYDKARTLLSYFPLYTPHEAQNMTSAYFANYKFK